MSLTLAVSDNQNGTGAVATISGSSGGTVTVYAQAVDGTALTSPSFVSVGSRVGDGTVSLSQSTRYYWWYAIEGSTLSNFVYGAVTDNTLAVHERCVQAIKARIQGLTLTGLDPANVFDFVVPNDNLVMLPCVSVSIEGDAEETPGTLTSLDDISYPVRVVIADRGDVGTNANRAKWLLWRQTIHRALRNQRLAGVTEVYTVRVTPLTIADPKLPAQQYFLSGFRCNCLSREIRG